MHSVTPREMHSQVDERYQVKEKAAQGWKTVVEVSGKAGSQVAQTSARATQHAMENQVPLPSQTERETSGAGGFIRDEETPRLQTPPTRCDQAMP